VRLLLSTQSLPPVVRTLNQILKIGTPTSYYDGTACYLDLVQWATEPAWRTINERSSSRFSRQD
jgi:hypothetical protein